MSRVKVILIKVGQGKGHSYHRASGFTDGVNLIEDNDVQATHHATLEIHTCTCNDIE